MFSTFTRKKVRSVTALFSGAWTGAFNYYLASTYDRSTTKKVYLLLLSRTVALQSRGTVKLGQPFVTRRRRYGRVHPVS
ncbi:hypothetical protein D3C81_315020 [compost metagenome]